MKEIVAKAKHVKESISSLSTQVKEGRDTIAVAAKKDLSRLGLVAGAAAFGGILLSLAGLLFVLFLILLLDVFVGRLWLSTLIVMSGMVLTGAVLLAYGIKKLRAAKEFLIKGLKDYLSRDEGGKLMVETAEDVRNTSREIMDAMKARRDEAKGQAGALLRKARSNAPAIVAGLIVLKATKDRRERKRARAATPASW